MCEACKSRRRGSEIVEIGDTIEIKSVVDHSKLASTIGSGDLEVFATPSMIALMEQAAMKLAADGLYVEETTVGVSINVMHTRATPKGGEVIIKATLVGIEDRKLLFRVTAEDQNGEIGSGTHERFVVNRGRFLERLRK